MYDVKRKSKLIIGVNGFLGTHLLNMFLANGDDVYVATRPQDVISLVPPEKQVLLSNLAEIEAKIETVFLLAAHIPYKEPNEFTAQLRESNVELPLWVVKALPQSRIIFASSASIYGSPETDSPIDENGPYGTPFAYGLSKSAGEMIIRTHRSYAILRLSSLFGPHMSSPTFIRFIIESALKDGHITLFGDGARLQNYLFVKDACQMFRCASELDKNGVYNAVGSKSFSNLEMAETIAEIIGDIQIQFKQEDLSQSAQYSNALWLDHVKDFSYTSLENALWATIDAFKK